MDVLKCCNFFLLQNMNINLPKSAFMLISPNLNKKYRKSLGKVSLNTTQKLLKTTIKRYHKQVVWQEKITKLLSSWPDLG